MFRVLSEDEAKQVTRWHAPELKGSVPVANTRQIATPVRLGETMPGRAAPPAHGAGAQLQSSVSALHSSDGQDRLDQGIGSAGMAPEHATTTSMPMAGQSADMLQASYDEGYTSGYAEGNAQLHQQSVQQLQAMIDTLGKPALKVPDAELEQEVMALSLEIARLVLGRELQMDNETLASLVRRGIEQLPNAGKANVQVHLNPLDAAMLEEVAQLPDNVDIVVDGAVKRSDCRIVSGASTVHGGLDDWLAIVGAELGVTSHTGQQA
ncbi:FliH/SctL family protein [Granulosicoccus sp. 3-233]|uniref:FliH/SctL family protein n=1 Tax=Granulosicoccus sp. 3-233 TaxID=3417969 RepID=UPI003D32ED30